MLLARTGGTALPKCPGATNTEIRLGKSKAASNAPRGDHRECPYHAILEPYELRPKISGMKETRRHIRVSEVVSQQQT